MTEERSPMNELEINRLWNELVQPLDTLVVSEDALDSPLTETNRRIQSLGTTPPPASSRARVQEQVHANVRRQIALSSQSLRKTARSIEIGHPAPSANGRVETSPGPWTRLRFPAERRRWLVAQLATVALLIVTLLGLYFVYHSRNQRAVPPPATPTSDVFFDRGNLARTGEMPGSGPETKPPLLWSFVDEEDGVFSSPAVVDGVVYVSNRGRLLALDSSTGTKQWEFPIQGSLSVPVPAVGNGLVYVGSTIGDLYAIDAKSGTQHWVYSTEGLVFSSSSGWVHSTGRSIRSSPLIADGVVYATTGATTATSDTDAFLIALNAETGEELWTFDIVGAAASSPAYDDGVIFVSGIYWVNGRSALFAVDAVTGTQRWMFQSEGGSFATLSIANGMVFTADDHAIYALDAESGTEQWHFSTDASPTGPSIAVANGIVYSIDDVAGTLYALDGESGTKLWEVTTMSGAQRAPVVAGSVLYLGTQQGTLLALDARDGHELWRQDTGSHILSSPTVSNGFVFFGDEGTLYALGDATEPSNSGE
jgi:outer membrane protein assembly factor BamB